MCLLAILCIFKKIEKTVEAVETLAKHVAPHQHLFTYFNKELELDYLESG